MEWTETKKQLPREGEHVLFCAEGVGIQLGRFLGISKVDPPVPIFSSGGGKWHYTEITHWMPMPKEPVYEKRRKAAHPR